MESLSELEKIREVYKDAKQFELIAPHEYVDELCKSYEPDENALTTTFESFDLDLKNKLRGKLGAFIGKGGCKKSLLAQQIARVNSKNGHRSIYSTMEMPATQLVERLIDMTWHEADDITNLNPSYQFSLQYLQNREAIKKQLQDGLKTTFGDKFLINQKSRMKAIDFKNLIERHNDTYGKADILIVDGLSMMGGSGDETSDYTTNSGELKDLANEFDIFIALICHVTKGCKRHTRNTRDYIRGSEKILDNTDFDIQLSLLQDESTVNGEDCEYLEDKGYSRLFNKRGTGNTINKIYSFNKKHLYMEETNLKPSDFEVKQKKGEFFS